MSYCIVHFMIHRLNRRERNYAARSFGMSPKIPTYDLACSRVESAMYAISFPLGQTASSLCARSLTPEIFFSNR